MGIEEEFLLLDILSSLFLCTFMNHCLNPESNQTAIGLTSNSQWFKNKNFPPQLHGMGLDVLFFVLFRMWKVPAAQQFANIFNCVI